MATMEEQFRKLNMVEQNTVLFKMLRELGGYAVRGSREREQYRDEIRAILAEAEEAPDEAD